MNILKPKKFLKINEDKITDTRFTLLSEAGKLWTKLMQK